MKIVTGDTDFDFAEPLCALKWCFRCSLFNFSGPSLCLVVQLCVWWSIIV